MKIAYVHDSPVPSHSANAVHVMKMCAALARQGAEVTLFCPKAKVEGNPYTLYDVPENFKICYIHPNCLLKSIPLVRSLSVAFNTAKTVKKLGYDFIFGRSTLAVYILRNFRPFIYESHSLPANKYRLFAEKGIMRSKNLLSHIVITQGLKSDYIKSYSFVNPLNITILQDAADYAQPVTEDRCPIDASKRLNIKQKPVIGYLGHLYPGKCMEILSQIARMRPQYDFHIVGGKDEWVNKWKQDEKCKNLDNIKFYGYVENKTIPYYYNLFDICILPFSNKIIIGKFKNANIGRWTSPLKLFEAMSYGKPILTTDLSTIKEVLTDNVNCMMVSENNIAEWCQKLDILISDESLRNKFGQAALRLFELNYTWDIRAKKIIDLFVKFETI